MSHYAGLDVSMKETFICIVDSQGKKISEASIETDPNEIASYFSQLNISIEKVGLESGSLSHWLTDELRRLELPVICIDARHIAAILSVKVNKTDRNDARGIADAMRCNLYKEVAVKNKGQIALCTLLNSRKQLVDQRVQLLGCIRGLLKPYGIRLKSLKNSMYAEQIREELKSIPLVAVNSIEQLLFALEGIIKSIKELDLEVQKEIKEREDAQLLMSIPGVGPITSLKFIAEISDPGRFKRSKSVGAYVGMTPRQYSSGEIHKQGRISKCGSKELRTLLMEAGIVILTRTKSWSKLKAWGLRLMKKHGLKKAAVAVGRKLGVIMHRMLVTGEPFNYSNNNKMKQAA